MAAARPPPEAKAARLPQRKHPEGRWNWRQAGRITPISPVHGASVRVSPMAFASGPGAASIIVNMSVPITRQPPAGMNTYIPSTSGGCEAHTR